MHEASQSQQSIRLIAAPTHSFTKKAIVSIKQSKKLRLILSPKDMSPGACPQELQLNANRISAPITAPTDRK